MDSPMDDDLVEINEDTKQDSQECANKAAHIERTQFLWSFVRVFATKNTDKLAPLKPPGSKGVSGVQL